MKVPMLRSVALIGAVTLWACPSFAKSPTNVAANAEQAKPAAPAVRTRIAASAQRNENVAVQQIDTNAAKESNVRVGTRATASQFTGLDTEHFAVEHGQPATEALATPALSPASWLAWRSILEPPEQHFQCPYLLSSRSRIAIAAELIRISRQHRSRPTRISDVQRIATEDPGMVNGNVLVPLASERSPLATDPAVRAIVQRFLNAYPAELPNRPDFDPRALNTNAPQRIDEIDGTMRLDRDIAKSRLSASYTLARQRTDAFQLVAGQNPDSEIHNHRLRLALRTAYRRRRSWSSLGSSTGHDPHLLLSRML